jgi:hypothetical protein
MHQELSKYFGIFLDDKSKSSWPLLLQRAAWWYNTAYHHAIGRSPYEALMGDPASLGATGIPQHYKEEDNFQKYYGMRREQLLQKQKLVQESLTRSQDAMLRHHNKNTYPIKFKVGDYVLYKNNAPKTKWDPKFYGPWKIIDRISPVVFELALNGYRFLAHAAKLKLYKGNVPAETEEIITSQDNEDDPQDTNVTEVWVQPRGGPYRPARNSANITGAPTIPSNSGPGQWIRDRITNFRRSFDSAARESVITETPPLRVTTSPNIDVDEGASRNVDDDDNDRGQETDTDLPIALRRTPRNPPPIKRLTYDRLR